MQPVDPVEEVHVGRPVPPIGRDHQGHLVTLATKPVQRGQAQARCALAGDLVVGPEAAGQGGFEDLQRRAVVVQHDDDRLSHLRLLN